jgi:hypothetical protein
MDCREYQAQFSDFLDETLSPEERRALQSHLKTCLSCYRNWSYFHKTIGSLRQLPSVEPPDYLSTLVMARLKGRLASPRNWLLATTYRWLPIGVAVAALLLVSVVSWWKLPFYLPWRSAGNDLNQSVTAGNHAPVPSSPADSLRIIENPRIPGQVVVLKVQDVTRAGRQLESLLQAFVGPMVQQQGPSPLAISKNARLIHLQVPSRRYSHLMRELVKIGHVDQGQNLQDDLTLPQPLRDVAVHIVVITDERGNPATQGLER